jgi:Enoyl-CoA hydratase/isomerase
MIDRCFFGNSVEQIMDNLRREKHPFATECLQQMERNSVISMNLALIMVRQAVNLDYKNTLQMELNVAFNKI